VDVGESVGVSVVVARGSEMVGEAVGLMAGAVHPAAITRNRINGTYLFGLITN